jgi:hypothetical protein
VASSGTSDKHFTNPLQLLVLVSLLLCPLVAEAAKPTLVQHLSSSYNPYFGVGGEQGNGFQFWLPNNVLAGNALVLALSVEWQAGRTVAITDNNGNTWPTSAAVTANDGANLISQIWVLPNANAGRTRITVTFDGGPHSISSISQSDTAVTVNTSAPHNLNANQRISITGVGVPGYNGPNFTVLAVNSATQFTYTNVTTGLGAISGGTVTACVQPFQYTVSEFNNVATVSPANGTSSSTTTVAPNLATGSFTPGNNDANGGNLIYTYFAQNVAASANWATLYAATDSFTLLHADIAWAAAQGLTHMSEYFVQTASAAINPGVTATMTPGNDTFNGVSVALKAASAGTAPAAGMRILKVYHGTWAGAGIANATSWKLHFPSAGNLLVLVTTQNANIDVTSVTDSKSNTYTKRALDGQTPQFWDTGSGQATPDVNLLITLHMIGPNENTSLTLYDITGAAPVPFDVAAGVTSAIDRGGVSPINNSPQITPSTANGLTIAAATMGQGPLSDLAAGAPTNAFFDFVYYPYAAGTDASQAAGLMTSQSDLSLMDNSDGLAHVYNTDTSQENWNWTLINGSTTTLFASEAVHYTAAPVTSP